MHYNDQYINEHTAWLNSIGAATFVINLDSNVLLWNRACETLSGVSSSEVLNTNKHWMGFYDHQRPCLADMVLDDEWEEKANLYDHIELATSSSRGLVGRNWCQTPAGNKFLIFEANALFDDDGNVVGAIETLSDATHLKTMEERVQVFSKAIDHSSSSIVITDSQGRIRFLNPTFSTITGYHYNEALNKDISMIWSEKELATKNILENLHKNDEWHGEIKSVRKDGEQFWNRCTVTNIKSEDGNSTYHVYVQEDITHEYENAEKLNYLAKHDQLTGLINRREFEVRVQDLLNEGGEDEHVICFIDLDKFKIVNDSCGHHVGDELLIQLADTLKNKLAGNGLFARVGGDEFSILLKNTGYETAKKICLSLVAEIEEYQFVWNGRPFKIGMSVGAVVFKPHDLDLTELFKLADTACYMAKELGTNRVHFYTEDDAELNKRHEQKRWFTKIQEALEKDLFQLDAQAIVPTKDKPERDGIHYEILIRMLNDQGDRIPPNTFLPAAERYDLMRSIDCYVIEKTLNLLKENPNFLSQVHFISINLSGQSLADEAVLNFITTQLEKTKIPCEKICFEITETAAITHLSKAINLINSIKKYGCSFALDDFGAGLSSFAYLKNLPVDYLKIDGMFVRDIPNNDTDLELVKSINQVGHALGMKTIAEFVEDDQTMSMLKAIDVDYAQGYGIEKPRDFKSIIQESETNTYSLFG